MQSVLISSKNKDLGREEAQKIFDELKISKFDITVFEFEKAVGIPDIREVQKKIYLKPFNSDIKAVLIDATTGITVEAQNALLKTLEESTSDTIIIVLVENSLEVLPTILSRCKVIEIKSENKITDVSSFLKILNNDEIGEKLKLAQDLAKESKEGKTGKEQSLEFLENLILFLRDRLLSNHYNNIYHYSIKIKTVQKFHTIIKTTNVNLRLALEDLFLNL